MLRRVDRHPRDPSIAVNAVPHPRTHDFAAYCASRQHIISLRLDGDWVSDSHLMHATWLTWQVAHACDDVDKPHILHFPPIDHFQNVGHFQNICLTVDPVSTTKMYENAVLGTYRIIIVSYCPSDKRKTHWIDNCAS